MIYYKRKQRDFLEAVTAGKVIPNHAEEDWLLSIALSITSIKLAKASQF